MLQFCSGARRCDHLGDRHYLDVDLYNTHVVSATLEKIDDPTSASEAVRATQHFTDHPDE
ncbi:hypothetical protein ACLOAV_000395 [Pseudogymnoascus australis]